MSTESKNEALTKLVELWNPALEVSIDAVGVVDRNGVFVYLNPALRSLIGARPRDIRKGVSVFNVIEFPGSDAHPVATVIETGEPVRVDEAAILLRGEKMRVVIKAAAARIHRAREKGPILGAIIQLRDSSAEIIVQAKYHKVMDLLGERDAEISALKRKVRGLQEKISRGYVGG